MSTERFLEKENERLRGRFNEAYRTTERIRTVLYGTDWTDRFGQLAGSTQALLDELRRVFQGDQIVVDSYASAEKAEAERDEMRARLAKVAALCASYGPTPHRAACHRCASLIRHALGGAS